MSTLDQLTNKCKNIIKNNSVETSIEMISRLKYPTSNELIGINGAIKIYKVYSKYSIDYSSKKYDNNGRSYNNKINKNFRKANSLK